MKFTAFAILFSLSPLLTSASFDKNSFQVNLKNDPSSSSSSPNRARPGGLPQKNPTKSGGPRDKPSKDLINKAVNGGGDEEKAAMEASHEDHHQSDEEADFGLSMAQESCHDEVKVKNGAVDSCLKALDVVTKNGGNMVACRVSVDIKKAGEPERARGGCWVGKQFNPILGGVRRRRLGEKRKSTDFHSLVYLNESAIADFAATQAFVLQINVHDECACVAEFHDDGFTALCPNTDVCHREVSKQL